MIQRNLAGAAGREFDLVIAGGGIYGASLLQEAARRGLSACLCEANDFGSGTSWNSLRIVHGGLRYLQTMDLPRFFQSVASRRRIARRFPALVRPLACLMPLYGSGLKRPSVMRMALLANDALSMRRNVGLGAHVRLDNGRILDAAATRREFPHVRSDGLEGAARWCDYFMVSSERILVELLRDASRHGALVLNYVRVQDIIAEGGRVHGVVARDSLSGATVTLRTRVVVNCTGARLRTLAEGRGGDATALFRPSLAFNLLLDASLPVTTALAVAAPRSDAPVLFLVPQNGSMLAGTMHLPRPAGTMDAKPTKEELERYLAEVRAAIPGFDVRLSNVRRVFAGLLPVTTEGTVDLTKREALTDHGSAGGLQGLYSVSGIKFTTANNIVPQILSMMRASGRAGEAYRDRDAELPTSAATPLLIDARRLWTEDPADCREALLQTVRDEAVQSLDDLILRRTNWATTELDLERVRQRVAELVGTRIALPDSRMAV